MMISHAEAQELHENIGAALEAVRDGETAVIAELERAREIAAVVVSDTAPSEGDNPSTDEIQPYPSSDACLRAERNPDPRVSCWFDGKPATHVAPRHSGGDEDVPAHWLPVCTDHTEAWFDEVPEDERLPLFSLPLASEPGAPGNDEPDERHGYEA